MSGLPAGTVTFLFTDIEGSTRLLHELGPERYAEALAAHRRILRHAFTGHGGVEIDTQGDAFFVAFPGAALPSGRGGLPAAQVAEPVELARAADAVRRARARAGRGAAAARARGCSPADADRSGRLRQDSAGRPGG